MKITAIMLGAWCASASPLHAFSPSYDCRHTAHTNVGWSAREKRFTAEAREKPSSTSTVKLTALNTTAPMLTGQGIAPLVKISEAPGAIWFAEIAAGGTIIVWTLFDRGTAPGIDRAILVSSKAYDFLGPQAFTDIYECAENSPLRPPPG